MRSPLFLALLIAVSGCAIARPLAPPESVVEFGEGYVDDRFDGASLAVVVGAYDVQDLGGVRAHLGASSEEQSAVDSAYVAFFAGAVPLAFSEAHLRLGEVHVIDQRDSRSLSAGGHPADGARLSFSAFDSGPDLVLLIDTLHVYRARYTDTVSGPPDANGIPSSRISMRETARIDSDIVLWDNREGRVAASGRLEAEEAMEIVPSRRLYAGAVAEFAEQLGKKTPVVRVVP